MKIWGVVGVVAALAIIGCGGGGSSTGTVGGGGGVGGGATSPTVNLPNVPGLVEIAYLTGQARSPGDITAYVRYVEVQDQVGIASEPLDSELSLPLKGFQFQTKRINVPFSGQNSRLFESFGLNFLRFDVEGSGTATSPAGFPRTIPIKLRAFPGRSSMVPLYLDDAIFTSDGAGGINFNESLFQAINQPDGPSVPIPGFISDYVSLDISTLADADKPQLSTGATAGRVYFSGDNYAVSPGGTSGDFEALTLDPGAPVKGSFGPPGTIVGPGGSLNHSGTYSLVRPNPVDLTGTLHITALQGTWRDYTSVLGNLNNFFVVTMPGSSDNQYQEMVMVSRNGAMVTGVYFGYVDYSTSTFRVYPIKNLVNADVTGELLGTVSGLVNANGASTNLPSGVRFGNFQFAGGSALPAGFTNAGRFTVFRR